MTFIVGFVLLGSGVIILSIARPRDGKQAAFMKSEIIESAVVLLTIVLVLGGWGILIGSTLNLLAGDPKP